MSKKIKILLGSIVLALGFFFCFCMVSVNAEEVQPATTDEQQEVVEQPQEETEQSTEQEEVKQDIKNALDWFKSLDAESVKGWLVGIVIGFSVVALIVAILVIALILAKTKNYKQTELYNQVVTKMDAEHQEKMEEKAKEYNEGLENLQTILKQQIAKLDDEKKEVARNNIAILKNNLDDIKVDLDK